MRPTFALSRQRVDYLILGRCRQAAPGAMRASDWSVEELQRISAQNWAPTHCCLRPLGGDPHLRTAPPKPRAKCHCVLLSRFLRENACPPRIFALSLPVPGLLPPNHCLPQRPQPHNHTTRRLPAALVCTFLLPSQQQGRKKNRSAFAREAIYPHSFPPSFPFLRKENQSFSFPPPFLSFLTIFHFFFSFFIFSLTALLFARFSLHPIFRSFVCLSFFSCVHLAARKKTRRRRPKNPQPIFPALFFFSVLDNISDSNRRIHPPHRRASHSPDRNRHAGRFRYHLLSPDTPSPSSPP